MNKKNIIVLAFVATFGIYEVSAAMDAGLSDMSTETPEILLSSSPAATSSITMSSLETPVSGISLPNMSVPVALNSEVASGGVSKKSKSLVIPFIVIPVSVISISAIVYLIMRNKDSAVATATANK